VLIYGMPISIVEEIVAITHRFPHECMVMLINRIIEHADDPTKS